MKVILDNRLKTIAELVRTGKVVADIGSDHAILPCYLYLRGLNKEIIASDINPNPLKSAEKNLKKYGAEGVRLVLSDGLKNINFAEDIIIAGMGGETILEIISELLQKDYLNSGLRLILQPMTRHEVLRRGLYLLGFNILDEYAANAGKKAYTVIHASYTGGKQEIDDYFAYIGKQENIDYIRLQLVKIKKKIHSDKDMEQLAKIIEDRIKGNI